MSAYLEPDPKGRDVTFLDQYATERWETVLHYMVARLKIGQLVVTIFILLILGG